MCKVTKTEILRSLLSLLTEGNRKKKYIHCQIYLFHFLSDPPSTSELQVDIIDKKYYQKVVHIEATFDLSW